MKLLYITNGINGSGGLERVLSIKASWLAEHYDYEVSILVLNDAHQSPFYEFSSSIRFFSITVGGSFRAYFRSYKHGIQEVVNQIQPDIISVCDDGLKGFFLPKLIRTDAKWIYERHVSRWIEVQAHQGIMQWLLTHTKWFLMLRLGRRFSRFVVLTEGNEKEWPSLKNLQVIPNPLSFYSEAAGTLVNKTVICVGKVSYQKGQDLLAAAWKKVHQKHPDWQLELYGKEDKDFLDVAALGSLNIQHYPPEKEIQQRYLNSSICVLPSRYEGFGMVLIEAMACGVPCIAFDCPYGPSDIIKDKEDGFLIPQKAPEEMAEKICFLIEREQERKRMGSIAKQNAQRFVADKIIRQWHNLFIEVMTIA